MKRDGIFLAICQFCVLAALLTTALPSCKCAREKQAVMTGAVPDIPYDSLREGDLVFRKGTSHISQLLTMSPTNKNYSHIGILFRQDGEWVIVHAVPNEPDKAGDFDRVKKESLEHFFCDKMAICGELCHTELPDDAIARMRERAFRWVNDSIRFDNIYDMEDSSRLYCTELVWNLYRKEGIDLTQGSRTIVSLPGIKDTLLMPEDVRKHPGNQIYFQFKHQYQFN